MLQASYRLLLPLALSPWQFQPDKVHKELELLKATIEKNILGSWWKVSSVAGSRSRSKECSLASPAPASPGISITCVGTNWDVVL